MEHSPTAESPCPDGAAGAAEGQHGVQDVDRCDISQIGDWDGYLGQFVGGLLHLQGGADAGGGVGEQSRACSASVVARWRSVTSTTEVATPMTRPLGVSSR